jgi:hypothetical protein
MTYVKLLLTPLHAVKPTSQALSAALLVLVVQLISGVPVLLAVRAEAYLATQVVVGAVVTGLLLRRRLDFAEFVGLGFAIGSLAAMCIDQLLVQTPIAPISWTLLPLATIAIVVSPKLRGYATFSDSEKPIPVLFIAFVLLFVLIHERYWPLYIALSIIPLLLFNAYKPKNMQTEVLVKPTTTGGQIPHEKEELEVQHRGETPLFDHPCNLVKDIGVWE